MAKATFGSVEAYLNQLPADRRAEIEVVRKVILQNLDSDFEEGIQYGMIGYYVPHRIYPAGYHCDPKQPLPFAGLASQKNYCSLYLMCTYGSQELMKWFQAEWKKSGKRLDIGKSCIRFKKADDVALDVVAALLRRVPAKKYIEVFQEMLNRPKSDGPNSGRAKTKQETATKPKATSKTKALSKSKPRSKS